MSSGASLEEKLENLIDLCNNSQALIKDGLDEDPIVNKLLVTEDGLTKMSELTILNAT